MEIGEREEIERENQQERERNRKMSGGYAASMKRYKIAYSCRQILHCIAKLVYIFPNKISQSKKYIQASSSCFLFSTTTDTNVYTYKCTIYKTLTNRRMHNY